MTEETLKPLSVDDFESFYAALYNKAPFAWQSRLALQACTEGWPTYIKLPTASGKTAAIDIAIFSLAFQAAMSNRPKGTITTPRRIFFVVDRRIIVNEAYRRASSSAMRLRNVLDPASEVEKSADAKKILTQVARWLQGLTCDKTAPPLDCFELRGGIYRNDAWVRSLLQPTVLTSTVDQVGSRLLFRGYGVSNSSLSIHAALTANDSLIILDEAHCSKPFSQTLSTIQRYRGERWASDAVQSPFHFVQMTATPPASLDVSNILQLTDADYESDELLRTRHNCSKPIQLVIAGGAKGAKLNSVLAHKLVSQAIDLNVKKHREKIAVVVNRVAIARECFRELEKKHPGRVHLMIGRMRPIDRDKLTTFLQDEFGSNSDGSSNEKDTSIEVKPQFVVATQCLEVGADLDFDGMVTQCASLDALRQRFGRLNRLGETPGACGVIVAAEGDVPQKDKLDPAKPLDPIYGNALARTWHWLSELSGMARAIDTEATVTVADADKPVEYVVDFGIKKLEALVPKGDDLAALLAPSENAPVLMPAHVDMLCQTSPRPLPEPDISAYLHGPNRGCPEIRVCWRADLDLSPSRESDARWIEAVDLCPPSTAECLAVPLHLFQKWLKGEKTVDTSSDVLGEIIEETDAKNDSASETSNNVSRKVLVWRGKRKKGTDESQGSFCAQGNGDKRVRPNDTIVIPVEYGGWHLFGHLPNAPDESTETPLKTFQAMMGLIDDVPKAEKLKELAVIDVADEAFLSSRAKTIFRAHPKLKIESSLRKLADELIKEEKKDEADFSLSHWQPIASEIRAGLSEAEVECTKEKAPIIVRLTNWLDGRVKGNIFHYRGGAVWITERHKSLTKSSILPLPTFGDDPDELLDVGKVSLIQHLSDVHLEAQRLVDGLGMSGVLAESTLEAAEFHDLGKADPRFQAMLINKPLSVAYMQPQLWAKSELGNRSSRSNLPSGFRHEMLSLALFDLMEYARAAVDHDLLSHVIAAHHGHARPFAPASIDESPESVSLASVGAGTVSAEDRQGLTPAHQLDSGVPHRFWKLNRKYGWWGLAFLESLVRLSDWQASAIPGRAKKLLKLSGTSTKTATTKSTSRSKSILILEGLDGSNPLAYLAALGTFRSLSLHSSESEFQLTWTKAKGAWRPALISNAGEKLTEEKLLDLLEICLKVSPDQHPAVRLSALVDAQGIRKCFLESSEAATHADRQDAEWLSCNGSELADPASISQLQTTRRDYHSINVNGLLDTTNREHVRRTLFLPWDYSDPIAGVSLHLEPREDRRHAYQWHVPSGDPTRSTSGGMIGANRLALEAWPLFQSLPAGDKLATVGFRGLKANNTRFVWPIWSKPIDIDTLRSVLSLRILGASDESDVADLQATGIEIVNLCRRILVGKTPNLTAPEPVLAR